MHCLESYGIDTDDVIPALEGGSINMIVGYMSGDAKKARDDIRTANQSVQQWKPKAGREATCVSRDSIVNLRKRVHNTPTNQFADIDMTYAAFIALLVPVLNILLLLPQILEETILVEDQCL